MAKKKRKVVQKMKGAEPIIEPYEDEDANEPDLPVVMPLPEKDPRAAKSPLKSKTFWTAILVSTIGFLGFIQAVPAVADNAMLSNLLLMAVGIVMLALRQVTNQPVNPVFNIPHMGGGRRPLPSPLPPYPQPRPQPNQMPDDNSGGSWNGWRDTPSTRAN